MPVSIGKYKKEERMIDGEVQRDVAPWGLRPVGTTKSIIRPNYVFGQQLRRGNTRPNFGDSTAKII